ncbi:MAG: hypothetical protein D6732_08195 [Methanobacteriota archaeon]|nr:MAG: hypothetical protein D6732_08195 [Euryarchaeota archaeon]
MSTVGRMLERTKLDELPQLWNILKGDMSFVGPRPEVPRFADLFEGEFSQILAYTPGIFGPNQVQFRNEADMYPPEEDPEIFYRHNLFPVKAKNDLEYFSHANCLSDLIWIVNGLWATLSGAFDWRRFSGLHLPILIYDSLACISSWWIAWGLRYGNFNIGGQELHSFLQGSIIIMIATLVGLLLGGCYRHTLRAFSLSDAVRLVKVITVAWLVSFLVLIWLVDRHLSFLLLPLVWLNLVALLFIPRVIRRIQWEQKREGSGTGKSRKVLIYGAGRLGGALATWLKTSPHGISLVGFVDDDPKIRLRSVRGVQVLGSERDLPTIHAKTRFSEIWVTFQPDDIKEQRLQRLASELSIDLVILPYQPPFKLPCMNNAFDK